MNKRLLTNAQVHRLANAFKAARGEKPVTLPEFQCIVSWAEKTIMERGMLDAVLSGVLNVDWGQDEPLFVEAKPYKKKRSRRT